MTSLAVRIVDTSHKSLTEALVGRGWNSYAEIDLAERTSPVLPTRPFEPGSFEISGPRPIKGVDPNAPIEIEFVKDDTSESEAHSLEAKATYAGVVSANGSLGLGRDFASSNQAIVLRVFARYFTDEFAIVSAQGGPLRLGEGVIEAVINGNEPSKLLGDRYVESTTRGSFIVGYLEFSFKDQSTHKWLHAELDARGPGFALGLVIDDRHAELRSSMKLRVRVAYAGLKAAKLDLSDPETAHAYLEADQRSL